MTAPNQFADLLTPTRKLNLIIDELGRIQEMIDSVSVSLSCDKWKTKFQEED